MFDNHEDMVRKLRKSGEDILKELSPQQADAVHMVMGIIGEAGELLDAIKKNAFYQKPLDTENVLEELGDIEFFLEGLRQNLGIDRQICIEGNIAKLSKRYSKGSFSNEQAQTRADKQ
jgi:NTP pyrophosphatase (non-canonical NTP hydrolase)